VGRIPLYFSFLFIVLSSSLVVGLITYQLQANKAAVQQRHAQMDRIRQRLVELQGTINDFNRRGDHNAIHRAIARLSADPTLKALVVFDTRQQVHYSSVIDYRNRSLAEIHDIDLAAAARQVQGEFGGVRYDPARGWVIGRFPLDVMGAPDSVLPNRNPQLLGIFDISASLQRAIYAQQSNIIQQVLLFLGVLVLAFLLLYGNIRSRINRIIGAARRFIDGDYDTRVKLEGNDEFAAIARTFDQMAKDIQDQHSSLKRLAHYDDLTLLPNRACFVQQLGERINVQAGAQFSVLFIDLDRFKVVNDSLGHHVGDEMLQVIAHRIRSCVKEGDVVARFGGDEFLVLLADAENQPMVIAILGRLLRHIGEVMMLEERPVSTTASIGVARYPRDGQTPETLIQRADIAMYQAKHQGKNTYHFYRPEIDELSPDQLSREYHLRQCIERGEVLPYFQPIYDAASNRLLGLEALAHMPDGQGGILPPDGIIPVIEETGLMAAFGPVMLRQAVSDYQAWLARCTPDPVPYLALNLSCSQLDEVDFLDQVDCLLADSGVDPRCLEFEITEGTLIRQVDQKRELLGAIRERGIRIAVDDFGTGYSSLSYLKKLPLDTLKIDRSFVRDINLDKDDNAIIETIIAMAAKLGLGVVAEGVESREQLAFLLARQCTVIQGFYLGRPVPIARLQPGGCDRELLAMPAT